MTQTASTTPAQEPSQEETSRQLATAKDVMKSLNFGEEISKLITTAGTLKLTEAQRKILSAPFRDEDVYIKPDGLIYLSWFKYAERLNAAFGGTGWTMVAEGNAKLGKELVIWGFHLVVEGVYCGFAYGEQKYSASFSKMSFGEACEGAKSNALMRLCKSIGIGLELFDKDYIDRWLNWYAESEWVEEYGKRKLKWSIRKDAFRKLPAPILQALEFGFKAGAKKGAKLEKVISEFEKVYLPPPSSSLSQTRRTEEPAPAPAPSQNAGQKVTPPAPAGKTQAPAPSPVNPAQAQGRADRKGPASVEEIPMERITDEEAGAPPAQPAGNTGNLTVKAPLNGPSDEESFKGEYKEMPTTEKGKKPGETPRVLEAVKKLNDCASQRTLQKIFAEIKLRYVPDSYTREEQEVLRIVANQKFVKLGAGQH